MVQLQPSSRSEVIYPDSDGQPMADNTKQFRWIVTIKENLEWWFADDPNVFIAGDLLWYPVEGDNKICQAPDTMIVFDRPKGDRGSYKQWEEGNIPPQVVFEILSPGNRRAEMNRKLLFYDRFGVEEYYLYDPEQNSLSGWLRKEGFLDIIDPINQWVSPRLKIRFDLSGSQLQIFYPDETRFLTYTEIAQRAEQAEQRAQEAQQTAEQERQRAEQERQRAEQERQRAEQAEARAARLAERLRAMGVELDDE